MSEHIKKAEQQLTEALKGKVISHVESSSRHKLGFDSDCFIIVFTDGTYMFPMCDDEGNDAGVNVLSDSEGNETQLYRH